MCDVNLAMANVLENNEPREMWVLKNPVINLYLESHVGTVNLLTPIPDYAKKFKTKEEAIDFNHDSLSGDYEAVFFLF